MTEAQRIFGANLKRSRRRLGLTQEDLGTLADVHRTSISKVERGLTDPSAMMVAKLLVALRTDGGPLFEGVRPPGAEAVSLD